MPNYDYLCKSCRNTFEVRIDLKQKESGFQPSCPACGADNTAQAFKTMMFNKNASPCSGTPSPQCGQHCELECMHN